MNRSQSVFKLIDVSMDKKQNRAVEYSGIKIIKDIPYSDYSVDTSGDIYVREDLLAKGDKLPVVLNIHGGGFVMGDKKYRYGISSWWASKGYIVYNISYRLSPDVYFPENLVDLVDALNYLKVLAQEYPMDLSKLVITGDSSGGYSAAYLTALAFDDTLRREIVEKSGIEIAPVQLKPALCAPCCGIYDVVTLLGTKMPFQLIPVTTKTYTGFSLKNDLSNIGDYPLYDYLSPINFVSKDWCKVFMIWTWSDLICVDQGRPMYNAICRKIGKKKLGYYAADGLLNNHCFHLNQDTKESQEALAALEAFAADALDYHPSL
ncbi:MAG: alpha/beta hydrolase [Clostridia bacterium]|nr:alpha/beta hydrolase [Clostridia bacterium]